MKKCNVIFRSAIALFLALGSLGKQVCLAHCGVMAEGKSCTMSCAQKDGADTKEQAGNVVVPACCTGESRISQIPVTLTKTFSLKAPIFQSDIQSPAPGLPIFVRVFRFEQLGSPIGSSSYLSVQHSFANAPPQV